MSWKAYPAYKPSGVEWLEDVPEHWNVKRLKFLVTIRSGEDSKTEGGEFPIFGANGVIGHTANPSFTTARVLIGRVGSSGAINLANGTFGVSDNCLILDKPRDTDTYFLYYASLTLDLTPEINKCATTINRNRCQ